MKRLALVAVAVFALASIVLTATAAPESNNNSKSTPHVKPPRSCTAKGFRPFSAKVWRLDLWERGAPQKATIQAQRRRLQCAPSRTHREAMQETWQQDKHAYNEHRKVMYGERRYAEAISPPGAAVLETIRLCESGGDYSISTGNGFYGAYQFTLSTWASVGGSGMPHEASPREQDERAAELYRRSGSSNWPVCGI